MKNKTLKVRPIEAGFEAYRKMVIPKNAGPTQVQECRNAFFAGAAVLFTAMLTIPDDHDGPVTDHEVSQMDIINNELQEFGKKFDEGVLGKLH